jgi:hypothetical protein
MCHSRVCPSTWSDNVVSPITLPHTWPHFLLRDRQHRCLPRQFPRFVNQLEERELILGCFQQDRTMCYTLNSVLERNRLFVYKLILKEFWQSLSPDVTPSDVILRGSTQGRVLENKTAQCWRPEDRHYERNLYNLFCHAICKTRGRWELYRPVFRRRETIFSIFRNPVICTSTEVCTRQVSFSVVNISVISAHYFGPSSD